MRCLRRGINSRRRSALCLIVVVSFIVALACIIAGCSPIGSDSGAQQDSGGIATGSPYPSEPHPPDESPPIGDAQTSKPPNTTPGSPDSGGNSPNDDTDPLLTLPYTFTAVDLYGNAVTERTLGEKEVFFIHYWGTWCPPCISEMPDIGEVAQEYGDRVGFIGLLDDYASNLEGAIKIAESSGIPSSFIMVDANEPSVRPLLELVQSGYVPTTTLIHRGEIDGPYIGAYGKAYAELIEALLP